ncbi:MAG TPA: transcriptional repressor [Fulvivirga sp.]|nr:transcriptional repressor [Fulvivirga sp.]
MEAREVLENHALKTTSCRHEVLGLLLSTPQALSQSEIEKSIDPDTDRVTVYRTLKTFLEKGLIHKVLDDSGATKYALCIDCGVNDHNHEHVHFKCNECGQTSCLDKVSIPVINLPPGYKITEKNILVHGICQNCG